MQFDTINKHIQYLNVTLNSAKQAWVNDLNIWMLFSAKPSTVFALRLSAQYNIKIKSTSSRSEDWVNLIIKYTYSVALLMLNLTINILMQQSIGW